MKARVNIIVLLSLFLLGYIIIIGVYMAVVIRKVNLMSPSSLQVVSTPQASPQPLSTPQALVPQQAPMLASQPSQQAPEAHPLTANPFLPSNAPQQASPQPLSTPQALVPQQAPMLASQPSQQAPEAHPLITTSFIPSNKAIEESIEIERQRQQMVKKMLDDRRKQEAKVRAAVENALPRNKP